MFELQEQHYLMYIFKRSLCLLCDSREAKIDSGRAFRKMEIAGQGYQVRMEGVGLGY